MSKYKVIVTARSFGKADDKAQKLLEENGCFVKKLVASDGPINEQLEKEITDTDAIIAGLEDYNASLIGKANRLKVISRYGVGYEKVDLKAASEHKVLVTITPGANGDAVADLAVALMLACARNVTIMNNTLKDGKPFRPLGLELWDKTLGVVGAGRIGKGVARRCCGFNMKILCYDQYQDEKFKEEVGANYVDFDTLIRNADFITIHSPLTPQTQNMFGAKQFKAMKKTAILVNTARGGIVNENDLYEALKNGEIHAAALDDIVSQESESKLAELDNCILTPHAGATTVEASSKMSLMAAQNVLDVLKTGNCKYKVN
ncbi:MAG: 4-phosphoerythronate dehydrogenase [Oscillospiraceae bacterium]|jgi:lactate dehydrogenase-like 2-hydroxyacid dehydrogenase